MKLIALSLALAAATSGCRKKEEPAAVERRPEPIAEETPVASRPAGEPYVYANARVDTAPVPARFRAPLPTTLAGFRDGADRHPPRTFVHAAVCAGDAEMLGRLETAVRAAAERGPVAPELAAAYQGLFRYCYRDDACDWLAAFLTGDAPRDAHLALWPAAAQCRTPRYAALITHADAPDAAVLDWYWERSMATIFGHDSTAPFSPRLVETARRVIESGAPFDVRKLGMIFASLPDERAMPALYELYDATDDPERRATLAVGLGGRPERKARRLYAAACRHPEVGKDPLCERDPAPAPNKRSIDERVAEYGVDVAAWIEREPTRRDAILAALARCATSSDRRPWTRASCLGQLAAIDRPRAVEAAGAIGATAERPLAAAAAALRAYPEAGALAKQLAAWELIPADVETPPAALTARDILEAHERIHAFDVETGMFPNEHDALLAELAALAAPDLDGVVFEEIPPADFDGGTYALRAYLAGKRYTVTAQNHGDWYDLEAVLGLLNVLAEARGSEVRYVPLPTGDQTASILAGPRGGIAAAARADLLPIEAPSAGMESGKAFEERVFRQMVEEGKNPQRDVVIDGTAIDQIGTLSGGEPQ